MEISRKISIYPLYKERVILFLIVIGIIGLVAAHIIEQNITLQYSPSFFLLFHTLFELFSVFVSLSIFFYGFLSYQYTQSIQRLYFSLIFLAVGSFDFVHTLTYKGMPFFNSELDVTVATWFWVIARLTESIGLAFTFVITGKKKVVFNDHKNVLLMITILFIFTATIVVFMLSHSLPILVRDGEGVTSLKIGLEYMISTIHIFTFFMVYHLYVKNRSNVDLLTICIGIVFISLSELVFTLYSNVYDLLNILGHIYKVLGYFFFLKGLFLPQFKKVYKDNNTLYSKWLYAKGELKEHEQKVTALIIRAQEEERKKVSRDLHDGVGQALYSMLISLKMLEKKFANHGSDLGLASSIKGLRSLVSESMDEVKNIAFQLRPSMLDDLGLIPAIQTHIEKYKDTFKINVDLHIQGMKQRLTPEKETALFRIFQEALTNAAKYSDASQIHVIIIRTDHDLNLTIEDNGKGFDLTEYAKSKRHGLGLYSMKERAHSIKGVFDIYSKPGAGTVINVKVMQEP